MGAVEMLRSWQGAVSELFAGALHRPAVKSLAAMSLAMAVAGQCRSGAVAAAAVGRACVASHRRRFERLLAAGPRLRPRVAMAALARRVLGAWAGRRLLLILDETPRGPGLCCMRVSVAYRKRAVPLAYACYRPGKAGRHMGAVVRGLLARVARAVPREAAGDVTLLADRGLAWACVVDACRAHGWHHVLRVQATTHLAPGDGGPARAARELAPRPGCPRRGTGARAAARVPAVVGAGRLVQARGLAGGVRDGSVGARVPRALAAGQRPAGRLRPGLPRVRQRSWCEQGHRDDKSAGLGWERSRVDRPDHAARLLLVMALATLLLISLGTDVIKRGLRPRIETARTRRRNSVFQLGRRWLTACLVNARPVPLRVSLYPP